MKQTNQPASPPRFALWLLEHFCAPHLAEYIEGDLYELFYKRTQVYGERKAKLLFIRDVLLLMRPNLLRKPATSSTLSLFSMLPSYLLTALRNMGKYKTYTAINVFGLTLSITSCLLILLYLQHELSYDKFHTNAKHVYRIVVDRQYSNGNMQQYATTSFPLGPALQKEFSQIQSMARVFSPKWISEKVKVSYKDNHFYEDRFFFADTSLFNLFTIDFMHGSPTAAFSKANAVVISEKTARKYFGNKNPLGEILHYEDSLLLEITGIFADLPSNTHLKVDFISTMAAFGQRYGKDKFDFWGWDLAYTYLLLPPHVNTTILKENLPAFFSKHTSFLQESRGFTYQASLQTVTDIHLHSHLPWEIEANGHISSIYILITTVTFLLLIACINFMNLTSALASKRAIEVGIRKVFGAGRLQLIIQFIIEYMLSILAAILMGFIFTILLLPYFNELTHLDLFMQWGTQEVKVLLIALLGILIILTFLAGGYAATLLVRLHPVALLKKKLFSSDRSGFLKKGLLLIQFTFSIVLTIGALIAYKQYTYMRTAQLGFDKEQVVVIRTGEISESTLETLRQQLLTVPSVQYASASSGVPGGKFERMRIRPSG
jgi:putative ABC transport system permease protein